MDRMTPPAGCNRYWERIGALLLGKLDNSCKYHHRAGRIQ